MSEEYLDTEKAAARLGLEPHALRRRLQRAQRREGRDIVAHLGGGIVGFKFGKARWRVRFPAAG